VGVSVSRWADSGNAGAGRAYAARFAQLAESGRDMHGEASLCAALAPAPARVLDAGCGTGRVAVRLAELGYQVAGVDVDSSMLAEARRAAPELTWVEADLAELATSSVPNLGKYDLVVAAGNVVPLVSPGSEAAVVAALAAALRPGGLLVAGFGLTPTYLPIPEAPVSLDAYDSFCAAAGVELAHRWSTWDGKPYDGGGYAVSVHQRAK
jgi:SAM-dependent methyltransferase